MAPVPPLPTAHHPDLRTPTPHHPDLRTPTPHHPDLHRLPAVPGTCLIPRTSR